MRANSLRVSVRSAAVVERVTLLVALEEEDEGAGEIPESRRSYGAERFVRCRRTF